MLWKEWVKNREEKIEALEKRAKGFADLKPRHIKRATEIYRQEFIANLGRPLGLNDLFDLTYGESIQNAIVFGTFNPYDKYHIRTGGYSGFYDNPVILQMKHVTTFPEPSKKIEVVNHVRTLYRKFTKWF